MQVKRTGSRRAKSVKAAHLSRTHAPEGMTPIEWQRALRRQFGREQGFWSDPSAPAHPWIERDPATGARSLRVPLPPPAVTSRIADAFSTLADLLRRP